MSSNSAWPLLLALFMAGCDGSGPAEPGPLRPGDPDLGRRAFLQDCASCHASRDGFDLAFFAFPEADIIRRGVAHVDSADARDIVTYIQSLAVEAEQQDVRPFQPGTGVMPNDSIAWRNLVGAGGWSDVITVDWLRSLDLRDIAVSLPFPLWSAEFDESDWMPEVPLAGEVLDAEGGAVRMALDSYYHAPTLEALLDVVTSFRRVVGNDSRTASPVCAGSANAHVRPLDCFEARRWVASLTAVHLLREGKLRDVPFEVAQLWWEVGEAAVTLNRRERHPGVDLTAAASWLYMSSIFVPDGFPGETSGIIEEAGYMGQFLQSSDRPRLAVLVTLRRLVERGPLHLERPFNSYRDVQLAVIRTPRSMFGDVMEFGLRYLLDEQAAGRLPTGEDLERARVTTENFVRFALEDRGRDVPPDQERRIRQMVQRLLEGLEP